jgi:diguanylate cyclase (GGDEF)-like protein
MFKKKLLVIDDTDLMRKLISDVLQEAGYDVILAVTGQEGIEKVSLEKPDLVILDVVMPEMDGFEVCKILREDDSNNLLPIIILTAQNNEDDKLTGLELGADDYIVKPFNERELVSRVKNTLRRIDRNRWANPLTGLQGNLEIQNEINHRIALGEKLAVIYADLDNFKAFNDVYGFSKGDIAIKMTADIIIDAIQSFGGGKDFIGHVGGDDFLLITTPDKSEDICKEIIKVFDNKIVALYNDRDRESGFIVTKSRRGTITKYPIMSISMGIVTNEKRELENQAHIAEISAELKKKAKSIKGSVYVKDKRIT